MNHSRFARYIGTVLCLATAVKLTAAAVSFTEVKPVTSETDILNTGTLIVANNVGNDAETVTINGIVFGNSETDLVGGWMPGGGDFSGSFSGPLDNLFSSLLFTPTTDVYTLNISGLTIGDSYRLQLLFQNDINSTGEHSVISIQSTEFTVTGIGTPQNIIVEFTALSSTEVVSFLDDGDRVVLNGYAVHASAVPEPGSAAVIIGAGVLGLTVTRRRRRA